MAEKKQCQQCNQDFTVEDEDLEFYKKISPELSGEVLAIPSPDICTNCREMSRIAWRNERSLYKRKCAMCGEETVSVYSEDKTYNVLCPKCFWSDKYSNTDYAMDYDDSKSFWDQFETLMNNVYLLALVGHQNENCDFVNQETNSKNCYMNIGGYYNKDSYYSTYAAGCDRAVDCYGVAESSNLYECVNSTRCNNCRYLTGCDSCNDCMVCQNCIGCHDCFGSINLVRKEYYFFNEKLSKEEFKDRIARVLESRELFYNELENFKKHRLKFPFRYSDILNSEDCTGDVIKNSKNAKNCFAAYSLTDCKNLFINDNLSDSHDTSSTGKGELDYNCASSVGISSSIALSHCFECNNSMYSYLCFNSSHLIGCIGLNHKEYCILNKQYPKDEYERLAAAIIKLLKKEKGWGNFLPMAKSPFCYNETIAMEYFPLDEDEAAKIGAKWRRKAENNKPNTNEYIPKSISHYDPSRDPGARKNIEACLSGVIKCKLSGRFFRVIPQELRYYIKEGIDIPDTHPDLRHIRRLAEINPRELHHRQCMNEGCTNEFETTYAPDRTEKVYCEECYQRAII